MVANPPKVLQVGTTWPDPITMGAEHAYLHPPGHQLLPASLILGERLKPRGLTVVSIVTDGAQPAL